LGQRSVSNYKVEITRYVATLLKRDGANDPALIISTLIQAAAKTALEHTDTDTVAQILRKAARELYGIAADPSRFAPHGCVAAEPNGTTWHVESSSLHRSPDATCADYEIELSGPFGRLENISGANDTIHALELAEQIAETVRADLFDHLFALPVGC